jgi:hypothetical protein
MRGSVVGTSRSCWADLDLAEPNGLERARTIADDGCRLPVSVLGRPPVRSTPGRRPPAPRSRSLSACPQRRPGYPQLRPISTGACGRCGRSRPAPGGSPVGSRVVRPWPCPQLGQLADPDIDRELPPFHVEQHGGDGTRGTGPRLVSAQGPHRTICLVPRGTAEEIPSGAFHVEQRRMPHARPPAGPCTDPRVTDTASEGHRLDHRPRRGAPALTSRSATTRPLVVFDDGRARRPSSAHHFTHRWNVRLVDLTCHTRSPERAVFRVVTVGHHDAGTAVDRDAGSSSMVITRRGDHRARAPRPSAPRHPRPNGCGHRGVRHARLPVDRADGG